MSGNSHADFASGLFGDRVRDLIGDGRILIVGQFLLIFFLGEFRVLLGDRAFRHDDDREAASVSVSLFDRFHNLIDIVRDLRDQDDIRAARDACVKRKPSDLVSHDLHDEDASVGTRCCVDIIDALCRDINRALEAEGHVGSPEVVVDRLGKCDHVETFFAEKVGCLGGSVSAAHYKAIQLQLVIGLLHCLYLVEAVLIGLMDRLKRHSAGSQDGSASCQDSLEVLSGEHVELAVDEAFVTIFKAIEFHRFFRIIHYAFENTAHCSIQRLAVAAARKKTDSQHLSHLLFSKNAR